ncbi:MAG: hypothetical protein EB072_01165 [Betaproteobacteria bacterium]|nr:hypothetical protein [Betaproteobacteria bacterium]
MITDLEKFVKEAQKLGAREGAAGRPLPDAKEPDANEVRFSVEANKTFQRLVKSTSIELDKVSANHARLSVDVESLRLKAESFNDDFDFNPLLASKLESIRPTLIEQIVRLRFAEAAVREFKEIHGLTRNADYHRNPHEYWSTVVLLFALEGLVNAFFYSVGGDYISGLLIAFGVSLSLLAVGCLIGWQFRYTNSTKTHLKVFGWFSVPETALLVSLCSGIAAYRVLLEKQAELIRGGAIDQSINFAGAFLDGMTDWTVPFKGDLSSVLAFVIAVCVSLFFIFKGYKYLDPVPGYDGLEQSKENERKACEGLIRVAEESVSEVAHEQSLSRQEWLRDSAKTSASVAQLAPQIHLCSEKILSQARVVIQDFAALIKLYRSTNQNVAPTIRPIYFSSDPSLTLDTREAEIKSLIQQIEILKSSAAEIRDLHENRLRDQLNRISDQQGKMFEILQDFRRQCDSAAANRMSQRKDADFA